MELPGVLILVLFNVEDCFTRLNTKERAPVPSFLRFCSSIARWLKNMDPHDRCLLLHAAS